MPKIKTILGEKDATNVDIKTVSEAWSEITLTDGAILKVKQNVVMVNRIDGEYDPDGNPLYAVTSSPVMMIKSVPEALKRRS